MLTLALASQSKNIIAAALIVTLLWLGALATYVFFYPDYFIRITLDAGAAALFVWLWQKTREDIRTLFRDLAILHGLYALIALLTPIARSTGQAPVIFGTPSQSEFYLVAGASDAIFVVVLIYISIYAGGKIFLDLRASLKRVKNGPSSLRRLRVSSTQDKPLMSEKKRPSLEAQAKHPVSNDAGKN